MSKKTHFPDDIHEKYIMGRLSETDREAYEAHLQTSPESQADLAAEKLLISSIRAAGRADMKDEIRRQTAQIKARTTTDARDWSMIFKVAAVLCIVAIVPYMYYLSEEQVQFSNASAPSEPILAAEKEMTIDAEDIATSGANAPTAASRKPNAQSTLPTTSREKNEALRRTRRQAEEETRKPDSPISGLLDLSSESDTDQVLQAVGEEPGADVARKKAKLSDRSSGAGGKVGGDIEEKLDELVASEKSQEFAAADDSDLMYQAKGLREAGPEADPLLGKLEQAESELRVESELAAEGRGSAINKDMARSDDGAALGDAIAQLEGMKFHYLSSPPASEPTRTRRRDFSTQQNRLRTFSRDVEQVAGEIRHAFQSTVSTIGITFQATSAAVFKYRENASAFEDAKPADNRSLGYPLQLTATTILLDSTRREMKLLVPTGFLGLNPNNMQITLRGNQFLELRLADSVIYDLNIEADTSTAILRIKE